MGLAHKGNRNTMIKFKVRNVTKQFGNLMSIKCVIFFFRYLVLKREMSLLAGRATNDSELDQKRFVLFLMNSWGGANVPYYQVYLAKILQKSKFNVDFLHDSYSIFPSVYNYFYSKVFQNAKGLDRNFKIEATFRERRKILKIVKANVIWQSRSEFFVNYLPHAVLAWLFKRQLRHYLCVKSILEFRSDEIDTLIIPGGVYSVSASYVLAALSNGIDFYTYDSGVDGELVFCKNGIASHMSDVEQIDVSKLDPTCVNSLINEAEELLRNRAGGTDCFRTQKVPSNSQPFPLIVNALSGTRKILIPLSCPWDSASLFRQDMFESELKFLEFVLKKYSNDTVIVRFHPVERYWYGARNDKLTPFLSGFSNCVVVSPNADVNTYDLLKEVDLVICRNTTLGAECQIMGIPVISTTKSYWNEKCDFNSAAISKKNCKIFYALAQKRNWIFPTCNLQNVRQPGVSCSDFPEFKELIMNKTTITKMKSDLIHA
jgi:hypothetical protein